MHFSKAPFSALVALLVTSAAQALPVTNFDHDAQGATVWTSSGPGTDTSSTWTFGGIFSQGSVTSSFGGIGSGYLLTGGGATAAGTSYNSLLTDTSIEVWIKPTSLSGGKQVIFTTGAAFRGVSITLWDDVIHFAAKGGEDNNEGPTGDVTHTLQPSDIGDFIQVVATLASGGAMSLYVNPLGSGSPEAVKKMT